MSAAHLCQSDCPTFLRDTDIASSAKNAPTADCGGFKLTRRLSGIVHLFCSPSAERITVVSAIAAHARVATHKDQLQDEPFDRAAPSMTVYIEAPTLGALANSRPRVPHVSQCWRGLNRLSTTQRRRTRLFGLRRLEPHSDNPVYQAVAFMSYNQPTASEPNASNGQQGGDGNDWFE
jgi:hypothetical protein